MKTSTVLKRALRLLDGGRRWIQGVGRGRKPGVRGDCHCAVDAVITARKSGIFGSAGATEILRAAVGVKHFTDIYNWNDAPHRRWSHVEAAFKRAIKLAEKEERR